MKISEIFFSIQGEGPFLGMPAAFIRLAGCPKPHCAFCDTKYAREMSSGLDLTAEGIWQKLINAPSGGTKSIVKGIENIIITGGEPFYQWGDEFRELISLLKKKGANIHFETSGRISIPEGLDCKIIASPKYLKNRWDFVAENHKRVDFFKFVVFDKRDIDKIQDFINIYQIRKNRIYLMPGGKSKESLREKSRYVWEMAQRLRYHFTPRLHIMLFGSRPGV